MTNAPVEDRPVAQADTEEPANLALTEAQQGTEGEEQAQTGPETEQESTEARPDARTSRIEALAEAEREAAREEGRQAERDAQQQGQTQQQRDAAKQRLRQAFPQAQQKLDQIFARAVDEYGQPRALTSAEQTEAKNALAAYNLVAGQVAEETVADYVREIAYGKLPNKDVQDAFTKATDGDTDLATYLDQWVEHAALGTKAVKAMDLESAMKASAKLKKEVLARDVGQFDAGREQGRLDPPGTSPDGGRSGQRAAPGNKTYIQLEEGYGRGELTKAEEAQYIQLREARKRS